MKTFEKRGIKESLERSISAIARAYGFTTPPVQIPKKDIDDSATVADQNTLLVAALAGKMGDATQNTQAWGVVKSKGASRIVFAIANPAHAIAQAFVVKASVATAETAGLSDCTVLVTSVGDAESRRRYVREMGNFFKKNAKDLPEDVRELALNDPDAAVTMLIESEHPLAESLPRTIDYLSEPSRKIMLETISLLETLEIQYELTPRLPFTPDVSRELVFMVEGTNKKGERVRIASGGRYQEDKKDGQSIIGMSVTVPGLIDARDLKDADEPACFVVHVGEAAKLKAFGLLDALLTAHVALDQALLATSIQDQLRLAQESGAKYAAIVGQREALDGTAILKNLSTQLQETVSQDKLIQRLARVH